MPESQGLPRYRPSGRVRPRGLGVALVAALAAGAAIGWLDAAALGVLPATIALALPVTLGVAILLAVVAGKVAHLGHVRSPLVAALVGLVLSVAADAASFQFARLRYPAALHDALVTQDEALTRTDTARGYHTVNKQSVREDLLVHPPIPSVAALERELTLEGFLRERLDVGWSFRSLVTTSLRGSVVIGIWIAEALLFVLFAAIGAAAGARDPYCEACGRFATVRTTRLVNDVDFRAVRTAADAGRMADVLALPRDAKAGKSVLFDALACPGCGDGSFVSASILPAGARGARPSTVKEFLGRMSHPFGRRRAGGGTSSRVDTHLFERAIFTNSEHDALFPSAKKRPPDAPV